MSAKHVARAGPAAQCGEPVNLSPDLSQNRERQLGLFSSRRSAFLPPPMGLQRITLYRRNETVRKGLKRSGGGWFVASADRGRREWRLRGSVGSPDPIGDDRADRRSSLDEMSALIDWPSIDRHLDGIYALAPEKPDGHR